MDKQQIGELIDTFTKKAVQVHSDKISNGYPYITGMFQAMIEQLLASNNSSQVNSFEFNRDQIIKTMQTKYTDVQLKK